MESGLKSSKNKKVTFLCLIFLLCVGVTLSCYSPRANPFDPENPNTLKESPFDLSLEYSKVDSFQNLIFVSDYPDSNVKAIIWNFDWDSNRDVDISDTNLEKTFKWKIVPEWDRTAVLSATLVQNDGQRKTASVKIYDSITYFDISQFPPLNISENAGNSNFKKPGSSVRTIALDSSKNIWAADDSGFIYAIFNDDDFGFYNIDILNGKPAVRTTIKAILVDKNNIKYFGRKSRSDNSGNTILTMASNGSQSTMWGTLNIGFDPLPNVTDLELDKNGDIIIATENAGIHKVNNILSKKIFPRLPEIGFYDTVNAIEIDKKGELWIGFKKADVNLIKFKLEDSSITEFTSNDSNGFRDRTFPNDFIEVIRYAADSSIWVGTRSGLARYDGNGKWEEIILNNSSTTFIEALAADKHGTVWIGTRLGLFRFRKINGNSEIKKFYFQRKGISESELNWIKDIIIQDTHTTWLATNGGIIRLFQL